MIEEETAIANAELVLDKQGFSKRKLVNAEFFDGSQACLPFLKPREPHYVVRFANFEIEDGCVLDDGDSLLCVEVDGVSGQAKFLKPFE
jgi:hypothetical protein